MDLFDQYFKKYPKGFGIVLSIIGVMILTPDTMVMRFSNLDQWSLMGWRGVLMGVTLILIWRFILKPSVKKELLTLYSWKGVVVIIAFSINSIFFTLGILETSVMLVLTALATMPVFAAILSIFMLKEAQGWIGWLTIIAAMVGVSIAVGDGNNAIGQPGGSIILGALYGAITAFGLALTFTMARKYPDLAVLPAGAIGALFSGIIGFAFSSVEGVFNAPIWTILCMGVIILPVSFTCLMISPRYTTSAIVSLIMLLEMVIGPFWVWIGIGERPSIMMIFGSFLVLVVIVFHIFRTQFSSNEKIKAIQ
jgi:drug/metabolite transporter (DMT)-like permease